MWDMMKIVALVVGWLLDLLFGDPVWLPHPVVGFGRWIAFWEHRLNRGGWRMTKGGVLAVTSVVGVFGLIWLVFKVLLPVDGCLDAGSFAMWRGLAGEALAAILIFFCLAGHTLRREVRDVFVALDRSLEDGRRQVARIVGRDTAHLSPQEVRTAALETLAENLSDGVVAPLFWLALLGVPGMMAYKMVNTLDSMLGYRTERYRRFGCWAARIDDVANFIPARLTALLMLLGSLRVHNLFRFVLRYGPAHASPNSGWPEAALAGILDCRFGGTHDYFGEAVAKPYIGSNARELTTADMRVSLRVAVVAECLAVALTALTLCV